MVCDKATATLDQVLQRVGEFGRFQKLLDAMLFLMNIPIACQILITYFATLTPTWKCRNGSSICLHNNTLSGDDNRRCSFPRKEWYYTEPNEYSLVTQFDIHCGKEWVLRLLSSIYFLGWGSGGIVLGWIGDKYGRKTILFPSIIVSILAGFITSFLQNIYLIVLLRFIIGFFNPGSTLQSFILISEYVGSKQRPFAGIIVYLSLPVGYLLVAIKAYLTRNWQMLYIICTIPYIFLIASYKFVPESVKWLLLHGRVSDAKNIIRRIAYWNKTEFSDNLEIYSSDEICVTKTNLVDIFRTRKHAFQTLLQSIVWLVTGIVYFGISLAADDLGGNSYGDFIILSIFELPALALAIILCNRFGRKPATLLPLFVGGLSCILVVFIPIRGKFKIFRVVFGIFGKFCLSLTFDAVYTWSVEIYPTNIRSKGMGFLQAVTHIGSGAAPWIVKGLKPIARWLPFVAMGIPALIGAVFGLWLPETKYKEGEPKRAYNNSGLTNDVEMRDGQQG